MKNSSSDQLTLLVFKDNQSPRTFQVRLSWLSRVGFLSVGWIALTLVLGFLSIRFYRQASLGQASDPEHLRALQAQIAALRAQPIPTATVTAAAALPVSAPSNAVVAAAPVPAVTVTVTATPPVNSVAVPGPAVSHSSALLFQALPAQASLSTGAAPIKMDNLRSRWNKHKLLVSFNLEYAGAEGGNQAGRIIILARGGSTLLSYPEGVFNSANEPSLINVEKGEYFSVSRFRETNAQFGPVGSQDAIQELEILIFGQNETLLLDQKIKAGIKSLPTASQTQEPKETKTPDEDTKDSSDE